MSDSEKRKNSVVLGVRTTPEQYSWMIAQAQARALTLQKYFEQVMAMQPGWPERQVAEDRKEWVS